MQLFEGKSPAEKNKLILAIVLGGFAVIALAYTFGGSFFGGKKKVTTSASTPTPTPDSKNEALALLDTAAIDDLYSNTPVNYNVASFFAPDAGRNIFAFYEPPPYQPTPIPVPTVKIIAPEVLPTPKPPPPAEFLLGFMNTTSVYAGSKGFKLEINGDKFTPESAIFLNEIQLPTTFVSPQRLTADVSANLIANAGNAQIIVRTPDGTKFSNPMFIQIIAAPRPQFTYIGMIARSRYNNDTAYFAEQGKTVPLSGRLNDVVGGRFKLVSISSVETIFEDTGLGFRYKLPLERPKAGQSTTAKGGGSQPPLNPNFPQGFPQGFPPGSIQTQPGGSIPGIPDNIPRATPFPQQKDTKKDYDDDDDDGDGDGQQ
jgi:hypothetical protein